MCRREREIEKKQKEWACRGVRDTLNHHSERQIERDWREGYRERERERETEKETY